MYRTTMMDNKIEKWFRPAAWPIDHTYEMWKISYGWLPENIKNIFYKGTTNLYLQQWALRKANLSLSINF